MVMTFLHTMSHKLAHRSFHFQRKTHLRATRWSSEGPEEWKPFPRCYEAGKLENEKKMKKAHLLAIQMTLKSAASQGHKKVHLLPNPISFRLLMEKKRIRNCSPFFIQSYSIWFGFATHPATYKISGTAASSAICFLQIIRMFGIPVHIGLIFISSYTGIEPADTWHRYQF